MTRPARIETVETLGGFRIRIGFSDRLARELDLEPMLHGGDFELLGLAEFAEVRVDKVAGTVAWRSGMMLDPDILHGDHSPATGTAPILLRESVRRLLP